jgi:tetratricopeptide (TPR) repeat protein
MKKALLILGLAALALCQTAVYWNVRLLDRAVEGNQGPARRAADLELAARIIPWNGRVHFELGRAAFERAADALGEPRVRDAALDLSVRHFLKALRLDPGSAEAHLRLAQSLQYMSYLPLATPVPYFEEYKKAAALTGHRSQIFFEVGRVLFGRWESLRPDEREFTLDVLRRALAGKDLDRLRDLLEVWDLHGRDHAAIEKVLPADAGAERLYARFLGEKGLALEARWKALARAETLDFVQARNDLGQAIRTYEYAQNAEASARVTANLKLLEAIEFYQDLAREELIDPREHAGLLKTARLFLARSVADRTRSLAESAAAIEAYLSLEDQPLAVGELERFLAERGLVGAEGSAASRRGDLLAQAVELGLDFKQNKYRDITMAGELLEKSTFVVPEAGRAHYARILRLVGDSYMKLDYLYEAERFYLKALAATPDSLAILLRLEGCYERLSDDGKLAEVRLRLAALLGPPETDLGRKRLAAGEPVRILLACEGGPLTLAVMFEPVRPGGRPLLTAIWNGRVVWEGFAENGRLSFSVKPVTGANSLALETILEPVTLVRLERGPAPAGTS